jgi:hypothetical protein
MEVRGQFHAPAALLPGKAPWRLGGGGKSRSGHGVEKTIASPRWESNPDHPIVQPVVEYFNRLLVERSKKGKD